MAPIQDEPSLPPGWAIARIDDFSDHCLGKMLDSGKKRPGRMLPYLRNINVRWGTFDLSALVDMPFEDDELDRYGILDGDILICEGGEPGRCAVWRNGPTELKIQKALHRVRCSDGVVPEFIAWQLEYLASGRGLAPHLSGTTIKHLPGVALKTVDFRIAPTSAQRRITARIDALFGEIEAGNQELERTREGLADYRRAVLKAAVTGELTRDWREAHSRTETAEDTLRHISSERERSWQKGNRRVDSDSAPLLDMPPLPAGWAWATLDDLTIFFGNGLSKPPHTQPPGDPILRISAVRPFAVNVQDRRYYREQLADSSDMHASRGDLLFTRYNGSRHLVGVCGLMRSEEPIFYPDKIMRARPILPELEFAEYLEIALNCGLSRRFIESNIKTTAGQQGISGSSVRKCPLPLPPPPELCRIVEIVRSALGEADELNKGLSAAAAGAAFARQSILKAAFSGRLVPQDESDKPASDLIDRLRSARNDSVVVGRRRGSFGAKTRNKIEKARALT